MPGQSGRDLSLAPTERASPAPLPGARDCSAFKGHNSRPQHACKKFLGVRATASCPPATRLSIPVVLVLHGAIHRQAGGKVIVYSVCGEWHDERPCGVEPWRREDTFAQAVDVQQLIRCQIARSIQYTSTIIVALPEEANSQAQSLLALVLLL